MAFNSKSKGQLEIIIVAAIVVVAVTVVIFSAQEASVPPPPVIPDNIQSEQELVRNSVVNSLRSSADDIMKALEAHGGYASVPDDKKGVVFLYQDVALWQGCSDLDVPTLNEIESRFENEIFKIITETDQIANVEQEGVVFHRAEFSVSDVDVQIMDNEIEVVVDLPTDVRGFPMEPYNFKIPSKFGRIYKFASAFAQESAEKRFFEDFLVASIWQSDLVPWQDTITTCGITSFSGQDIADGLRLSAFATTTTEMWKQPGLGGPDDPVFFGVPDVGGVKYEDLEISFHLEDDFSVDTYPDLQIPNLKPSMCAPSIGMCTTGICGPVHYNIAYDLNYPVIVRVGDPSGAYFNFAVMVGVEEKLVDPDIDPSDIVGVFTQGISNIFDGFNFDELVAGDGGVYVIDTDGSANVGVISLEDSDFIPNSGVNFELASFVIGDSLCWFDGETEEDGRGGISEADSLWVDSNDNCDEGYDQSVDDMIAAPVNSDPASGKPIWLEDLGLVYVDSDLSGSYDDGEPIYLDLRDGVQDNAGSTIESLNGAVSDPGFVNVILSSAGSVTETLPSNHCGLV